MYRNVLPIDYQSSYITNRNDIMHNKLSICLHVQILYL